MRLNAGVLAQAGVLIEAAPAKVNLALHVRRRRADGYHDLETIFAFTDFGDTLSGAAAEQFSLTVDGEFAAVVGAADDLVLRAARALASAAGVQSGAALALTKRIPVAAGLGGGSADAAATLRLLNRLWRLDWSLERLAEIGGELGADVPACVFGTAQVGYGRGEQLTPYAAKTTGTPILLVNPRVAMPTGSVFAKWDGTDRGALDPARPLTELRNDLTEPAQSLSPVVESVLAALEASGAAISRMSGSGATCFGLFDDERACSAAERFSIQRFPSWWTAATTLR